MIELNPAERSRYARHLILHDFGEAGQLRLKQSSVLLVGAGGLGSPAAMYLAAAGVGRIGIIDSDVVDASNLHRQVLYAEQDVGAKKIDAALERLQGINAEIDVETHDARLTSENALELVAAYDVVVDGTDNFPTRYLVNDACVMTGRPNVYGSIYRFEGQLSVFDATRGPCYRCIYPDPPPPHLVPSCAEGGVLGVLPGVVGTIQATEAIKLLAGIGEPLIGRLLLFDALRMTFRTMQLRKDPHCKVCGDAPTITQLIDYEELCMATHDITPAQLAPRMSEVTLLDVREPYEVATSALPNCIHIPMQQVPSRLAELPREAEIVVYCRVGGRSAQVAEFLRRNGFANVRNLIGGLRRWASEVDPGMPVA